MLQLTGNLAQGVCNLSAYFWSVGDEFFAHGFVWDFGAAYVHNYCNRHFRRDFVATPVHGCNYAVRNVACFVVEKGDFVSKTINHECAAFRHVASISHSQFNDEWVTSISGWFSLVNYKVLGFKLF